MSIKSNSIQVFPSARRVTYQRTARLFTEKNLTNIVNQLLNVNGFVITRLDNAGTNWSTSPFEFNIAGYYFRVGMLNDILDATDNVNTAEYGDLIVASITLAVEKDISSSTGDFRELIGQDDEDTKKYNGITFKLQKKDASDTQKASVIATENTDGTITYSLILLVNVNNGVWATFPGSMIKFDQSSLGCINCGEITPTTTNETYIQSTQQIPGEYLYIKDWGMDVEGAVPLFIGNNIENELAGSVALIDIDGGVPTVVEEEEVVK